MINELKILINIDIGILSMEEEWWNWQELKNNNFLNFWLTCIAV